MGDSIHLIAAVVSPVVAAILTSISMAWLQRRDAAYKAGVLETSTSISLADTHAQLKKLAEDMATEIEKREAMEEKLFNKMDEVAKEARNLAMQHPCSQSLAIGAMQNQIQVNTERFLRMEQHMHDVERSLWPSRPTTKEIKEA